MHSEKWKDHFKDFEQKPSIDMAKEIERQLIQSGFALDVIEKRKEKNTFNSQEEFFDFIRPKIPALINIPQEKAYEFLSELFNLYILFEKIDFLNTKALEIYSDYLVVVAHKR